MQYGLAALAFALSLPNAFFWVAYIRGVQHGHAFRAALWDGAIVLFSNVAVLTLWHESGNDIAVLLSSCAAGVIGTYLTVRWK